MNINEKGLDLIKRFEGLRLNAYRDAVGVWTIGYGHTGRAGAPAVRPGMRISKAVADEILQRDVNRFARAIAPHITAPVNANQFSALVSFAYNVGPGAFRRSSVLRAVNARNHAIVARRLGLWVKAGGRTLNGLIARRAAEAVLYNTPLEPAAGPATPPAAPQKRSEPAPRQVPVEPQTGKPAHHSTINLAALISAIAGVFSSLSAGFQKVFSFHPGPVAGTIAAALIMLAAAWIIRERWLKSRHDGV